MMTAAASGAVVGPAMPSAGAAAVVQEVAAGDAIIAWFRGEFAAANAIIDALCAHLVQTGGTAEYKSVFAAVHRRRLNWIPVLHMQKYYSIASVGDELRRVAASKKMAAAEVMEAEKAMKEAEEVEEEAIGGGGSPELEAEEARISVAAEEKEDGENPRKEVEGEKEASEGDRSSDPSDPKTLEEDGSGDGGSQSGQASMENINVCSKYEGYVAHPVKIKTSKGFVAKEPVKGHMVNVVKGLKLYEDIFTDSDLLRLAEYINELHLAGRRGELSGETYIFFNKEMKGNKREIIQLGVPLFQPTKEGATGNNEPIPPVLQTVVDHLVQWRLIPDSKRPNSCIINFFDEDEHSQPYQKPPHLDNPISTLLLSDTAMAFGRMLVNDNHGNYRGSLTLQLKGGSLLVMRGNSADMARHVVCPSSNRRVIITFMKVQSANKLADSPTDAPLTKAMTLWQPGVEPSHKGTHAGAIGYVSQGMIPTWGMTLRAPVVMLAPRPLVMAPGRKPSPSGTGVFLPWTVGHKKYTRHLPPRIQKSRLPSLPSPMET